MSHVRKRGRPFWLSAGIGTVVVVAALAAVFAAGALGKGSAATPIKLAIMSDCQGPFGFGYNLDLGGAISAFSQYAGAKPTDPTDPSKGMSDGSIGGHPVHLVGIGCGNDTVPLAISEIKRLMEQLGADIEVGPLSGSESISVANYAKSHPTKTFVNGTAGAQETTLKVRAPNFFRFNGDGAQWNAGIGEIAYNRLHWRTAAVIMDDYAFAYASAAGMIADFCAVGGKIVKRVFPPLNNADYATYVRQLPPPSKVDGYFWAVGGNTLGSLKAYETVYGPIQAKKFIGNLFFSVPGNYEQLAPRINGAYVGGFGNAPDFKTAKKYTAIVGKWFKSLKGFPGPATNYATGGFFYNYYMNAWGLIKGLQAVKGSLAGGQKPLQQAIVKVGKVGIDAGVGGRVTLDTNRAAIQDQYSYKLVINKKGVPSVQTVMVIPRVDQTWGGHFTTATPALGRNYPNCVKFKLPWAGTQRFVNHGVVGGPVGKNWAKLP
jgi:branched-chain amino acid transport system substrate-binding protein